MSTFNDSDLFAVQRGTQTFRATWKSIKDGVPMPNALLYQGVANPASAVPAPPGGLVPGMVYVLSPAGLIDASWTGIGGITALDGQLAIWEGAKWELAGQGPPIPDASETVPGVVELATAAETTTGTDNSRAVHPAGLKVELDKLVKKAGDTMTGPLTLPGLFTEGVTSTPVGGLYHWLQGHGVTLPDGGGISLVQYQDAPNGPRLTLGKSRSGVKGVPGKGVLDQDPLGTIYFAADDGINLNVLAASIASFAGDDATGGSVRGSLIFSTNNGATPVPNERMRIASNGNVLIDTDVLISPSTTLNPGLTYQPGGRTSMSKAGGATLLIQRTASDGACVNFFRDNATVGSISVTGSATAYNTSSDYRLKENVVPLAGAADRLKQLKPSRFNFIAEPGRTVDGFLAHEAQAVVPECVTGTKDEVDGDGQPVYQGIDQSKMVPLLTAALQEALAKIEALEARLSALERS